MIRAYNTNIANQTASFKCDKHDAYVVDYNLTLLSYTIINGVEYLNIDTSILNSGAELALCQSEKHITTYPKLNGTKHAQDLIAAKTG